MGDLTPIEWPDFCRTGDRLQTQTIAANNSIMEYQADVAIVGAGILGLAFADVAAREGRKVVLFERDDRAQSASVRNFGMIWPIGQSHGEMYQRALFSRQRWLELAEEVGFWTETRGSLHLALENDEWRVLKEFAQASRELGYDCELLDEDQARDLSPGVRTDTLYGALFSRSEMCVDPREAIYKLPLHLASTHGVELRFGTVVTAVQSGRVWTAGGDIWHVDRTVIASGADFRTLFPDVYADSGIRRCKLQMMRTGSQPKNWRMGPTLAGGLTLRHYPTFKVCPSLEQVRERIRRTMPEYDHFGIHVMVSQNALGELIVGDSHEYDDFEPFDRSSIDELILAYLRKMADLPDWSMAERWHGIYAKHPTLPIFIDEPESRVIIVNACGGSGMTMSFGWAADLWPFFAKNTSISDEMTG